MIKIDIKEHLFKTLSSKNIIELVPDKKVYFLHADNPTEPYIEYEVLSEAGIEYSEGVERYTDYLIQVDIFSKSDYSHIESIIKSEMLRGGYSKGVSQDLYEEKTGLKHKAMRFSISLPYVI